VQLLPVSFGTSIKVTSQTVKRSIDLQVDCVGVTVLDLGHFLSYLGRRVFKKLVGAKQVFVPNMKSSQKGEGIVVEKG